MKNVLVATDFSNGAYSALFYICKLQASETCVFYILNVYDELTPLDGKKPPFFSNKKEIKELAIQSKEKLTQVFHRITLDIDNPKHSFHTLSKEGNLSKNIYKTINEKSIDLLVIGSKGTTGAKEIFFGSNAIQLTNTMEQCPILVVPKQQDFIVPKHIAFITDYKKGCDHNNLSSLLYIISISKAKLHVLHIQENEILDSEQELKRKLLKNCLEDFEHTFHTMRDFANKAELITEFITKFQIDLFCMVQHKRSIIEKFMREPIIKDVSSYVEIPFLIVPERV